ncbi:phage tail protein [Lacinutrix chionoecetis]
MDQYIAQIMMFGGNFAPRGWALCNGQLLAIAQYQALFSLLGTNYGGDGRTTFGLPDLRGRVPVHPGQAPGTTDNIRIGQTGGNDRHNLTISEMPNHNHSGNGLGIGCNESDGTSEEPSGKNLGLAASGTPYNSDANDSTLAAGSVTGNTGAQGGSQAFNIRNPYTGVNYIIALEGIFPPRS